MSLLEQNALHQTTRRHFFKDCAVGLGGLALADMLQAAPAPMSPRQPPLPAKAKNVIYLFMAGATTSRRRPR